MVRGPLKVAPPTFSLAPLSDGKVTKNATDTLGTTWVRCLAALRPYKLVRDPAGRAEKAYLRERRGSPRLRRSPGARRIGPGGGPGA